MELTSTDDLCYKYCFTYRAFTGDTSLFSFADDKFPLRDELNKLHYHYNLHFLHNLLLSL